MIVIFAMLLDNISPFGTTWRQEGLFSETNAKVRITSLKKNTIDSFVKLSYKNTHTHTPVSVSVCVGNWIGVFIHRLLTIFPQMPSQTLCSNWSTDCFLSHHDTFILSASVFHLCPLSICPGNWAELRRDDTNRERWGRGCQNGSFCLKVPEQKQSSLGPYCYRGVTRGLNAKNRFEF